MQKIHFKPSDIPQVIFKKITSSLLFIYLLSALPLFAKNSTSGNENNTKIIISGGASIFDSENLLNDKTLNTESKEITKQKAIIIVSEDAIISNIEAFKNAEIRKIEKVRKPNNPTQKKIFKKLAIVRAKISDIKNNSTYYHSTQNSESLSQSQKEKIVFSTNSNQPSAKAIAVALIKKINRRLHFVVTQNFTYTDPNIKISYFFGKHSVRPPTLVFQMAFFTV